MTMDPESSAVPREPVAAHLGFGDLPAGLAAAYSRERRVAWDVETTGLDWNHDDLGTCQVYAPGVGTSIIRMTEAKPTWLMRLLEDPAVQKVFHHAPFDLRFMVRAWGAIPASIRCTKVASKLLKPQAPKDEHTLKGLLWRHLGVQLEKGAVRTSDWSARELSPEQILYATRDVLYLLPLLDILERVLADAGLGGLYDDCCAFLPARARLEVGGYPDVFAY
jgi:ribonuclease D